MKTFTYKFVPTDVRKPEADINDFNRLGNNGWELVGFYEGAAWFKKEVTSNAKPQPPAAK